MADSDDPSFRFLTTTRFLVQRVFVPILVCIGVGGNTITVIILTRKRMRCSTNIYLTALAIADIAYLLFTFFLSFQHYDHIHERRYQFYWRFVGIAHWLVDAASNSSVWLTVSFTLERYIAVCHPIRGRVLCTESRAKSIIVIVALFCIVTTASTTFEHELEIQEKCLRNCTTDELAAIKMAVSSASTSSSSSQHHHATPSGNSLDPNSTTIHYLPDQQSVVVNGENPKAAAALAARLRPTIDNLIPSNCTDKHPHIIYVLINSPINNTTPAPPPQEMSVVGMRQQARMQEALNDTCCNKSFWVGTASTNMANDKTYSTFIDWYSAIFFGLLPILLIATFNSFLVVAVYRSQTRRRAMTNSPTTALPMSNENRITLILISVVCLFLFCQTPTASMLIHRTLVEVTTRRELNIVASLGNIFNFLLALNAACNFILYCVLSKKYRSTFKSFFCGGRKIPTSQDTLLLSGTTRTGLSSATSSQRFKNGLSRNISEYRTPRNLETQSLTSIPRSKSMMTRAPGKAKSSDINV